MVFMVGLVLDFLRMCLGVVRRRSVFLLVLNSLFFGFMIAGAFLGSWGYGGFSGWPIAENDLFVGSNNAVLLFFSIFFFNLIVSGFCLVTLTGALFFVLPVAFLCLRGLLWGVMINFLPMPLFLVGFFTLVLEGEGYVLGALAGLDLGLSWLKPRWVYSGEEELSRWNAFKRAFEDCLRVYVLVTLVLFVAALVETLTLIFF